MKIITPGYVYELSDYSEQGQDQVINFYERKLIREDLEEDVVQKKSGTTCEEVLEVLIDRLNFLNNEVPSLYNEDVIDHLKQALGVLDDRRKDRVARGVLGTDKE